jgi:ureidoacrylate peracid hydrolase
MSSSSDQGLQSALGNMLATLEKKVEPRHSALLIVDVQNDFCSMGGAHHREGKDLSMIEKMIPRLSTFIEKARAVGLTLIYIRGIYYSEGNPYLTDAFLEQRTRCGDKRHLQFRVCELGTWGADFREEIKPSPGDLIITKHRYSAFIGTDLDLILRTKKIRTLLVSGVTTDVCVDNTTRVGHMLGYYMVVMKDLCATWSQTLHDGPLAVIDQFYGEVVNSGDVLDCWCSPGR